MNNEFIMNKLNMNCQVIKEKKVNENGKLPALHPIKSLLKSKSNCMNKVMKSVKGL